MSYTKPTQEFVLKRILENRSMRSIAKECGMPYTSFDRHVKTLNLPFANSQVYKSYLATQGKAFCDYFKIVLPDHEFHIRSDTGKFCYMSKQGNLCRKADLKLSIVEHKGGECEICGYKGCLDALELHHEDPSQKDFDISKFNSWNKELELELEKCLLVCCLCHREIHYKARQDKLSEFKSKYNI